MGTGADVRFAQEVELGSTSALLVHAGSTLQLLDWDNSPRWQRLTSGVVRVLAVVDRPPSGRPFTVVLSGERELELIDLSTGETTWTWTSPSGTHLSGAGSTVLQVLGGRVALVCFPTYATTGYCFDLCTDTGPRLRWERAFHDTYDAGFGPVVVIADPLELGRPTLVMSTRTGTSYGVDGDDVPTDKLVLGREDGHLYQAVLDLDDGATLSEASYRPDPGPYPCARPYGLLHVAPLAPDLAPDVILVSCQVEEYVSVTTSERGSLGRRWGRFIEKDWPIDVQELRPQVTSVADVRGDGAPLLVLGHWHEGEWATVLIDPRRGWLDGEVARLPGRYFWGCHDLDGDGIPELVVSVETQRTPSALTTVEVVDGLTLEVRAAFDDWRVLASTDSDLPPGTTFHAERAGSIAVPDAQGRHGLVLRRPERTSWWTLGAAGAEEVVLSDEAVARVDHRGGHLLLTQASGRVLRFDGSLRQVGEVQVHGRAAEPLSFRPADRSLVVAACGDGTVAGWQLTDEGLCEAWRVPGTLPALHIDLDGVSRLAVAQLAGDEHRVVGYVVPAQGPPRQEFEAVVPGAPHDLLAWGPDFHLVANLRTGVHTAALVALDGHGRQLWADPEHGAHPNRPAAFSSIDGGWLVAYDDHGELSVREAETGDPVGAAGWTAAYTTPVAVPGRDLLIRADGVHGIEAVQLDGTRQWRRDAELWSHYPGESALAQGADGPVLCSLTRCGSVEAVRAEDGQLVWTHEVGEVPERRPVVAFDVDDDGEDELVVGAADGRLHCVSGGPTGATTDWTLNLGAQIQGLAVADVDDDGWAELVVATADGRLRLVRV